MRKQEAFILALADWLADEPGAIVEIHTLGVAVEYPNGEIYNIMVEAL